MRTADSYAGNKLDLLHRNVKLAVYKDLEADLAKVTGICLTSDGWTSRANDPYLSLTLSYIVEVELKDKNKEPYKALKLKRYHFTNYNNVY